MRDVSVGKSFQAGENSNGFPFKMGFTGANRDNSTIISGSFDKKRDISLQITLNQ